MTAYLSYWARRIEELVQWGIDSTNYEETVSTLRVHKSLNHLGMLKAKHIDVMGDEVPKRNPWLASLCLYMNYTPPNSTELGWWFLGFNTESGKIVLRRFGLSPGSCPFLFFVSFLSGGRMPNDQ